LHAGAEQVSNNLVEKVWNALVAATVIMLVSSFYVIWHYA